MIKSFKHKVITFAASLMLLSGCGDFPDYGYDQSEDFCVMSFPFAGGIFNREYIGYFRLVSTLQYLDADPEYRVFATGPSNIELEAGSFQKLLIADKEYKPRFEPNHLEAELEIWGPAFLFDEKESVEIFQLIQEGNDFEIHGRLEVGRPYETTILNYFFESSEEPFRACINRLLDDEDLKLLKNRS